MILHTVALPVWNSKEIAWLCMESLCRQQRPQEGWELIIFEGKHDTQLGEKWFMAYKSRLLEVGCERVSYITSWERIPLSIKWIMISEKGAETSKSFTLCAADNYYQPFMMCDIEASTKKADWCIVTKGYFYDFYLDKVIKYHYNSIIGLQMTARIDYVRQFPKEEKWSGVDTWFANNMIEIAHKNGNTLSIWIDVSDHWKGILCTNGFNNISKNRYKFFEETQPPFYITNTEIKEIVPDDISKKIKRLSKLIKLQANESLGNNISI